MFSCRLAEDFCTSLTTLLILKMRMRAKYKLQHFSKCCCCLFKQASRKCKSSKFYASSLFLCTWIGPATKILFPMAVFLSRLMMLKVSMHENAREKWVALNPREYEPLETTHLYTNAIIPFHCSILIWWLWKTLKDKCNAHKAKL